MAAEEDLKRILEQEAGLVFPRFDEDIAFAIGAYARESGRRFGKGIVAGVYLWDRTMFYGATKGATEGNRGWAERKVKLVRLMHKSSYRVVLERGDKPRAMEPGWGLDAKDYALAGGAFPLVLEGLGIIGAVAVSGLHERDDHEISREAIAVALGKGPDYLALDRA
jgi:uncharacterized protein (UPF0303 family)